MIMHLRLSEFNDNAETLSYVTVDNGACVTTNLRQNLHRVVFPWECLNFFATGCGSFNLSHCSDCSSHREHIQGFFFTKESQSFLKPSSFKSRALKFPTQSIINAALSTNLLLFFTLCHVHGLQYRCLYTPISKHILESLDSI